MPPGLGNPGTTGGGRGLKLGTWPGVWLQQDSKPPPCVFTGMGGGSHDPHAAGWERCPALGQARPSPPRAPTGLLGNGGSPAPPAPLGSAWPQRC